MREKSIKVISVAAMLGLGIFLSSCGKKDEVVYNYEEAKIEYKTEFKSISNVSESEEEYFQDYKVVGDSLLYYSMNYSLDGENYSIKEMNIYDRNLKTDEVKKVNVSGDSIPAQSYVQGITVLEDGSFRGCLVQYDSETYKENYKVINIDKEGTAVEIIDFEDCFDSDDQYASSIKFDKDDNIIIATSSAVYKFDKNGQKIGKVKINDYVYNVAITESGKVYLAKNGNMGMDVVAINDKFTDLGEKYELSGWGYVYSADGDNLFFSDNDGLVYIDTTTKETKKLFDWINVDISTNQIENIQQNADGSYSVSYNDYQRNKFEIATIKKLDESEKIDKVVLRLATSYTSQNLRSQVIDFNRSSDKARIVVESVFEDDTIPYEDALKTYNQDLVAGKYDIVAIGYNNNLSECYKALTPLNDKIKKAFTEDKYYTNILGGYTIDDNIYAVPNQFSINTLAIPTKIANKLNSWTVNDLMNIRKEYSDVRFISSNSKSMALYLVLQGNLNSYIDISKGKCDFEKDEFRNALEFANSFPEETNWDDYNDWESIQNNETIVMQLYLSDMQEFQLYNSLVDGGVTIVGYPSENGGVHNIECDSALAISAKCKNKDLAWDVIEYLVNHNDTEYGYGGFYMQKEATDAIMKFAMRKNEGPNGEEYPNSTWGNETMTVEIYSAKQEEVDAVYDLLNKANISASIDSEVLSVITEEAEPYFKGQKSIEDTIKVIQSRVGIYLAEKN